MPAMLVRNRASEIVRRHPRRGAPPRHAFYEPEVETMPRARLARLQLERLRRTLANAWRNVPALRARLHAAGYSPGAVASLADLAHLPFTHKDELREHYPFGLFARPRDRLLRLHASSGTTGKPTVVGYTRRDLATWSALMARTLYCAGVRPGDVVHNAYGYGLFTGGLGFHYGAERLGATVVPVSGGATERQVALLIDFGARALCATPSYALVIAETAERMGVDLRATNLQIGLFGAEPWSEQMRREIEARLGVAAIDNYGLSEIMGPGVAVECPQQDGLHAWEDHFLCEVIDPATGRAVADGEPGELVITTLTKEALPMIRYRTRDVTRAVRERCACGRTHLRLKRVAGRNDDMLIVRGINLFPSQIEALLVGVPGLAPHYQLVLERKGGLDELTVEVEPQPGLAASAVAALAETVRQRIHSRLGLRVEVRLLEPGGVPRSQGKAVRVRDLRPR